MECEVIVADRRAALGDRAHHAAHVIVLGRPLRPGALSHIAQRIADIGDNIESVAQLSTEPVDRASR